MKIKQFYNLSAWKYFSRYVLLFHSKNGKVFCATCGKPMQINDRLCHCGHFRKVNEHKSTAFEFKNCLPQCYKCNSKQGGREYEFSLRLDHVFGKGTAEEMRIKSFNECHLTDFEFKQISQQYKAMLKELEKTKGKYW